MPKFAKQRGVPDFSLTEDKILHDYFRYFREGNTVKTFEKFYQFVEWSRYVDKNTIRFLDAALSRQLDYCIKQKQNECVQSLLNPALHVADLLSFESILQERAKKHKAAVLKAAASWPGDNGFWIYNVWRNTLERHDENTILLSGRRTTVRSIYLATLSLIYPERMRFGDTPSSVCDLAQSMGGTSAFLCNPDMEEICFNQRQPPVAGTAQTEPPQQNQQDSSANPEQRLNTDTLSGQLAQVDEQTARQMGCSGRLGKGLMNSLSASIPSARSCFMSAARQMASQQPARALVNTVEICVQQARDQRLIDSQIPGITDPECSLTDGSSTEVIRDDPLPCRPVDSSGWAHCTGDRRECRRAHGNDINSRACESLREDHVNQRISDICRPGDLTCAGRVRAAQNRAAREARINLVSARESPCPGVGACNVRGTSKDGRDDIYVNVDNLSSPNTTSNDAQFFTGYVVHEVDHRADEILGRKETMGTHADIYAEQCRISGLSGDADCRPETYLRNCHEHGLDCDRAASLHNDTAPDGPGAGSGENCSAAAQRFADLVGCTSGPVLSRLHPPPSPPNPVGPQIYPNDEGGGAVGDVLYKSSPLIQCMNWNGGIPKDQFQQAEEFCRGNREDPPDFCLNGTPHPACNCAIYRESASGAESPMQLYCSRGGRACPDDIEGIHATPCPPPQELVCGFREPPLCRCSTPTVPGGGAGGDPDTPETPSL